VTGQPGQVSWDRLAGTGQPGQSSRNRSARVAGLQRSAARTVQPDRSAPERLAGQVNLDRLAGQFSLDRTDGTCQQGQASLDRSAGTG
jgi:hypothetical protein